MIMMMTEMTCLLTNRERESLFAKQITIAHINQVQWKATRGHISPSMLVTYGIMQTFIYNDRRQTDEWISAKCSVYKLYELCALTSKSITESSNK